MAKNESTTLGLEMRLSKFTIEKRAGLWRFYHDHITLPLKKQGKYKINDTNLKNGRVFIKKHGGFGPVKAEIIQKEYSRANPWDIATDYDEQSHWCYDDETGNVYRWQLGDQPNTWKKKSLIGTVPPHTEPRAVLAQILERDITVQQEYSTQDKHRVYKDQKMYQVKWCREFDGKNILALVIAKPKMTYAEIKNIILNEGGTVDSDGTIHRD